MSDAYLREYRITIGTPTDGNKTSTNGNISASRTVKGSSSYTLTDIQFTATIKYSNKSSSKVSDTTSFELYNVDSTTKSLLNKKGSILMLEAGYASDIGLPVIYLGTVKKISTVRRGVDMVTSVVCTNVGIEAFEMRIARTFQKGVLVADVIKSLATSTGLNVGKLDISNLAGKSYFNGYSAYGSALGCLEAVCEENNLVCTVYNKTIQIYPRFLSKDSKRRVIKSITDADVQGWIEHVTAIDKLPDSSKGDETGVVFNLFLDGTLSLGDIVSVETTEEFGAYEVTDIEHSLNYEGNKWTTRITTKPRTDIVIGD